MEIITKNSEETTRLGQNLVDDLKKYHLIALWGDLGSGKTTLVQGLARSLGVKKRVTSPTFLIAKPYKLPREKVLWHVDLYRVSKGDLAFLSLGEILDDRGSYVVIEWPELIKNFLPRKRIDIFFEKLENGEHRIKVYKRF